MSPALLLILLIITVAIAISQFGVILYFMNFIKKNELHDGAVKDAQTKSAAIILSAVDKANDVVAQAEKQELQKISDGAKSLETLTQNVQESLQSMGQKTQSDLSHTADQAEQVLKQTAQAAEQAINKSSAEAQSSYTQFAQQTETTLQSLLTQDRTLLEQKTNQAIEQSSTMFQKFMGDVASQVRTEIDQEIKKANDAVDTYKAERLAAINTKVIDILEEVLLETLGKKLSLNDEGEFVYQALEQAKKEHAFS